ncbi:S-adenosyl-L-methionine-dependent methyltransferase [Ramicandelaber brevisporus]|nr:S-adenosyl-L-methionine-dependent methyltransferase [Ramicandelaber brevisporus]
MADRVPATVTATTATTGNNDSDQANVGFAASKLGTREHWDEMYDRELANFGENEQDLGEVWFGEQAAYKMVRWVRKQVLDGKMRNDVEIMDVGCGNGHLLLLLATGAETLDDLDELEQANSDEEDDERDDDEEEDDEEMIKFTKVLGVDYSEPGIALAKSVAVKYGLEDKINYEVADVLSSETTNKWNQRFDIILDKGTYDAICLCAESDETSDGNEGRKVDVRRGIKYPPSMAEMLKDGSGLLVITSCNWTIDELIQQFSQWFDLHGKIEHPAFKFGGKVGQSVSTAIFKKK